MSDTVSIPKTFVQELIAYFLTKPMQESEVAVVNLRHFLNQPTPSLEVTNGDSGETTSAS